MEYDALSLKYKLVNMRGTPDYISCTEMADILADVSINDHGTHQYTRGFVCHLNDFLYLSNLVYVIIGSSKISESLE